MFVPEEAQEDERRLRLEPERKKTVFIAVDASWGTGNCTNCANEQAVGPA